MITIEHLLNHVKTYNDSEVETIKKAYDFANELHKGQVRQSGEPYITHPLSVAYILSEMHADKDTICAKKKINNSLKNRRYYLSSFYLL